MLSTLLGPKRGPRNSRSTRTDTKRFGGEAGKLRRLESARRRDADDAMPLIVLLELGRMEDEAAFWDAVDWYFERAEHLHLLRPTGEK